MQELSNSPQSVAEDDVHWYIEHGVSHWAHRLEQAVSEAGNRSLTFNSASRLLDSGLYMQHCLLLRTAIASVLLLLCATRGNAEQPFADFDLRTTQVADIPVHYEATLEPAIDAIVATMEEDVAKLNAAAAEVRGFHRHAEAILADLNRLVGFSPQRHGNLDQQEILQSYLRLPPVLGLGEDDSPAPVYFVLQETIRTYLREGGELPDFHYNPATDEVSQNWGWSRRKRPDDVPHESTSALVIAVPDVESAAATAGERFAMFHEGVQMVAPAALHEAIEVTLIARLRPTYPHVRWFTDGYADALTAYLLSKHIDASAVDGFMAGRNVDTYADLKEQANLLTWPARNFELELDLPAERRLRSARYTFAMHEAMGLLERYGPEHVGQVLDHLDGHEEQTDRQLLVAMHAVTGEDVAERLRAYQPFNDPADGVEWYEQQIEQAILDSNAEAELWARLRQYEVNFRVSGRSLQRMSRLLRRVDASQHAFEPINQAIQIFDGHMPAEALMAMRQLAVVEALEHDEPQAVYDHAEHLLAEQPDNTTALAVRLHRQFTGRQFDEAEATAKRLLELVPDPNQQAHRVAADVLTRIGALRE